MTRSAVTRHQLNNLRPAASKAGRPQRFISLDHNKRQWQAHLNRLGSDQLADFISRTGLGAALDRHQSSSHPPAPQTNPNLPKRNQPRPYRIKPLA